MKKILIITLLLCQVLSAICQHKSKTSSKINRIHILVRYDDNKFTDTLYLGYLKNYWGPSSVMEIQTAKKNGKNSFYFDLENNDRAAYCAIYKKNKFDAHLNILRDVICEPGDSIQIRIKHDSLAFSGYRLSFTGKGAAKYQCQYEISQIIHRREFRTSAPKYTFLANGKILHDSLFYHQMVKMFQEQINLNRKITTISLDLLESYKNKLSTFIYNLLKADIISREEGSNYNNFYYPFKMLAAYPSARFRSEIEPKLRKTYADRFIPDFSALPQKYLALSHQYINYMVSKTADTLIDKGGNYLPLKNKYSGLLRDRIVTAYLLKYYAFKTGLDKEVKDALSYVKTDYCRKILYSFSSLVPGTPAYSFALPDSSGKNIQLSDLKGKVIIMDFWFTGCSGCAALTKKMKPIADYFKNNGKVVFVTVSIDKDIEEWKSSITSGKYTHKGSIDLFANGLAHNSPIMKHYNIIGCPTLILVDPNGRIITGQPPRPPKNKEFIALIEKHTIN